MNEAAFAVGEATRVMDRVVEAGGEVNGGAIESTGEAAVVPGSTIVGVGEATERVISAVGDIIIEASEVFRWSVRSERGRI